MKRIITLLSAVLFSTMTFAQAYNSPESIEFDYAHNRWLIANNNGNNILARNSANGLVTIFAPCSGGPHGIEIVNDTLYVNAGANIKLFNLNTGAAIATIALGANFLNGLTHDSNYLYATDFGTNKIYRVNIATRAWSIFVASTGGAVGSQQPNGILYDASNNRCVIVSWGSSAPIKAMDVTTGAISTILTSTLTSCDGITQDPAGNYYISSWGGNKITRYTSTFTSPTTVVTGLTSPAEIFYNVLTDTLGVTNTGSLNNTQYYYFGTAIGVNEIAYSNFNLTVSPNPAEERTEINYELITDGKLSIELFNIEGQLVKTIADENQTKGKHTVLLDKTGLSAGNYLLKLNSNNTEETKKVIIK